MAAVAQAFGTSPGWEVVANEPFSSARKWSAVEFASHGTIYFGAPDVLLADGERSDVMATVQQRSKEGFRVLLLARAEKPLTAALPESVVPLAVLLFEDTLRDDVGQILAFFAEQGVSIKVISGDNIDTVAAVAARAGVPGAHEAIDARTLPDDVGELAQVLGTATVFGRVTPHQKRDMVGALQSEGRIVAMTGDGVNDVLALKDADMGIAMGSGSAASRGVAELVLMDDRFATLPEVVARGRRVINNIERVANLFVTKATYAVLLTAIIGIQRIEFPFLPRHLTLIGTFSIGLPGIFLALAPDESLVKPGFLRRVLGFSVPTGIIAAFGAWIAYLLARSGIESATPEMAEQILAEARTTATVTLLAIGLIVLVVVSRPLKPWKVLLAASMAGLYALVMAIRPLHDYFVLDLPSADTWITSAGIVAVAGALIVGVAQLSTGNVGRSN
jgi:cation-transporting ATPase E